VTHALDANQQSQPITILDQTYASSLAKKSAASATSSGLPNIPHGCKPASQTISNKSRLYQNHNIPLTKALLVLIGWDQTINHGTLNKARAQSIAVNPVLRVVNRDLSGDADYCVFRRHVTRPIRQSNQSQH
jgi:hypothetical protein